MQAPGSCNVGAAIVTTVHGRFKRKGEILGNGDFASVEFVPGGLPIQTVPHDPAQKKAKKPKCKQSKTPEEHRAVEEQLRKVAPPGSIGNIAPELDENGQETEGIVFDVFDPDGLQKALNDAGFVVHTILWGKHTGGNMGNIFQVSDNRSPTSGNGNLGPDSNSNGNIRSLQVDIGKQRGAADGENGIAMGRADLDCSNPAQDVISAIKHFKHLLGF